MNWLVFSTALFAFDLVLTAFDANSSYKQRQRHPFNRSLYILAWVLLTTPRRVVFVGLSTLLFILLSLLFA